MSDHSQPTIPPETNNFGALQCVQALSAFWAEAAEQVQGDQRWDQVLDDSRAPLHRWFPGAEVNSCYNALDWHGANGRWLANAADVTGAPESLAWLREVLKGSGFATYLAGINPHKMDDEALAAITAVYRLLRLRRVAPLNGPDGPGDRVWLWPLLTLGALLVGLRWPRRRARG